jgi:signal recognition particle GTPase
MELKTTTIGKLAHNFSNQVNQFLLVRRYFRAAAADQLTTLEESVQVYQY